jgi:hypothetical protein
VSLYAYLDRLENTLYSRQDITVEKLDIDVRAIRTSLHAVIVFHDNSHLTIFERLESTNQRDFKRVSYRFHYQHADGSLIFRYDNSPHYPHLATFPAHKHLPDQVIAAETPDLADVLREVDTFLYPRTDPV